VEIGESELDEENLLEIEDMVSMCASLVTVDEESDVIRLIHYTTQEYFGRTQTSWFPNGLRDIATTCVTYLSFDAFETSYCLTDEEFEVRLQLNPLYDYAARNWGHHVRATLAVEQLVVDFLKSKVRVSSSSQAMMVSRGSSSYSQHVLKQMIGVHLAAYFGLKEAMIALLRNGHNLDSKDSNSRTPLSYATRYEHKAVVELLLEKGAKLGTKDNFGLTPLSWAVEKGHKAVVKLLLEKGAKLETKCNSG
jgi:ankyrin repeat protein